MTRFELSVVLCVGIVNVADGAADFDSLSRKTFDLVVVEATPGGIAMAVRAAREGLDVLLVNHNEHLGGILSSGLGVWDTLHEGRRAPIYDEARQAIFDHYRTTYGEDSPQYRDALPGKSGHTNGKFEPRVAEKILTALVENEPRITMLRGFFPVAVERDGRIVKSVTFRETLGEKQLRVAGRVFADCSYEGDLLPLAKVEYRLGREGRHEYKEPHAGVVYMKGVKNPPTPELARAAELHAKLKLRKFSGIQTVEPGVSTGAADGNVQAFNYRTILSSDPENRMPVEKPAEYDPEYLKTLEHGSIVAPIPNKKRGWNRPQLVGPHTSYIEGDWGTRTSVMNAHWQATMGLLYFLQNDPSVDPERQKSWKEYGLARDEFVDHGHKPYEFYVREGRRLLGRYVLTEHDATLAAGLDRATCHADSIGVTEWYLDTHACTHRFSPGCLEEGKMMLDVETFPGQVPYRALLPRGMDNLLVPVCLSSTHVAWGTIRLEPTWMNIAESAGFATAQAIKDGVSPADVDVSKLQRTLAERRVMLNFFNDVDLGKRDDNRIAAAQYFGTKGFFADYDARLDESLNESVAKLWTEAAAALDAPDFNPQELTRRVAEAERGPVTTLSQGVFQTMLPEPSALALLPTTGSIRRGEALEMLWRLRR